MARHVQGTRKYPRADRRLAKGGHGGSGGPEQNGAYVPRMKWRSLEQQRKIKMTAAM